MNREILFRGKWVDNGEWVYGDLTAGDTIHTKPPSKDDGDGCEWYGYEVRPETVGQYTGLKDKNGERVFEGDIVQGIVNVSADDYQNGKNDYHRYKDITACFHVFWDEELSRFHLYCPVKNKYMSTSLKGIGFTRRERAANAYREVSKEIKAPISKVSDFEIIGNIHDNPELLEKE